MHTVAHGHHRSLVPIGGTSYPGLPPQSVVIEHGALVAIDIDNDDHPDITHDRTDGTTLIHFNGEWRQILPTVIRKAGAFRHRQIGAGTVEVNLCPDLPHAFASAARNTITPEQEEQAEVTHAVAYLGMFGPFGSPASRVDWHAAGRIPSVLNSPAAGRGQA